MTKSKKTTGKSFKSGMDNLLSGSDKSKRKGRPITSTGTKEVLKESERGTKPGETRATFIVTVNTLDKIKAVAWYERTSIKQVLDKSLKEYLGKLGPKEVEKAVKLYQEAH